AAVANTVVARIALGELGLDELRRSATENLRITPPLQLIEKRLLAPEIPCFEECGADRQIGFGLAQALLNRTGRLPDFQSEIPQDVEQVFDDLLGAGRPLVGQQE